MDLRLLRKIDLFRSLDNVQLVLLASSMKELSLPKDSVLFREGDVADRLYIIVEGRVRISKIVPGIGEEALTILGAGTYFGEMGMIVEATPRAAQAVTHEDCTLWSLEYESLKWWMRADPALATAFLWSFLGTLSDRLIATTDKITAMFAMTRF